MSDSEENISCTPPDVTEVANRATLNLLPTKSRMKYEKEYSLFENWMLQKKVRKCSENVLLAFFEEKSQVWKSSTLWSKYSMLKAVLIYKQDIDISKFSRLIAFLKRKSNGYIPKKSRIFLREEINKFINDAPDETYLMMKVALVLGISGALRREELKKMNLDDILDKKDILIINVPESKTKISRKFTVSNNTWIELYRKYLALRPTYLGSRALIYKYVGGKIVNQVVGLNTIGKIPEKVAQFLKLDNFAEYTGHCFRRTLASLLTESGADIMNVKRHGGLEINLRS